MEFRRSNIEDINDILSIISQAQDYFKNNGIPQWQNGYPNFEAIKTDIKNNDSYVLVHEGKVVGTAAISFGGERTYNEIYDGKWLLENPYAVIHRIAVDSHLKGGGLSSIFIREAEKLCRERKVHSIRVDTHKRNLSMQKFLNKNGFEYCGIIYLEDRSERLAFEKVI